MKKSGVSGSKKVRVLQDVPNPGGHYGEEIQKELLYRKERGLKDSASKKNFEHLLAGRGHGKNVGGEGGAIKNRNIKRGTIKRGTIPPDRKDG